MKKIILVLSCLLASITTNAQKQSRLEHGDLLFNVQNSGKGLGGAIVDVTKGIDGAKISHVAIVCKEEDGSMYALEATGRRGVCLTPIDTFMVHAHKSEDGKPLVLVGRLKDRSMVVESVARAKKYLGRPYDWLYGDTEDAIYCSELVHFAYLDAEGNYIFPQQPMSFHDDSGKTTQFWIDYYKKYGLTVPEGEPGTNPGGISQSDKIEIISIE